jgi:cellulose synthase/poly-beta-1,6-N-acetylglucosamine synthase-like glycosyltransferase
VLFEFPRPLSIAILAATASVLLCLIPLGVHRLWLMRLWARGPRTPRTLGPAGQGSGDGAGPLEGGKGTDPPFVTVQLPIFEEPQVVARLIEAVARFTYPRDRFEVQILDDSGDASAELAARAAAHASAGGVSVEHIRRSGREGYKAGALAHGLQSARGEFLVVLDADFVPPPDLIERLIPGFEDPTVGMVQARWGHLNRDASQLTRAQSVFLDAHFTWEQGGRFRGGRFFNFNGTAGIWRRACLEDAGGWSAETLTEDLDLSYRAQMKGWRFVYRNEVEVPAELPPTVPALQVQQGRWAQGGIQTARKILPGLLRSPWPFAIKIEAVAHLLGHVAHPLTLALGVLLLPSAVARRSLGFERLLILDLVLFAGATLPFLLFYGRAARMAGRSWRQVILDTVGALAVGIGLSVSVTRSVFRGFTGNRDPFERTPKWGGGRAAPGPRPGPAARRASNRIAELGLGTYLLAAAVFAFLTGLPASLPFLLLFATGYLWLGLSSEVPAGA